MTICPGLRRSSFGPNRRPVRREIVTTDPAAAAIANARLNRALFEQKQKGLVPMDRNETVFALVADSSVILPDQDAMRPRSCLTLWQARIR